MNEQGSLYNLEGEVIGTTGDLVFPKPKSRLLIGDNLVFEMTSKIPNAWYRFWYKILLGWKWEAVE